MKIAYYSIPLGAAFLLCSGCSAPLVPWAAQTNYQAEMYAWTPPSAEDLQLRRFRQGELDNIAAAIDRMYLRDESLYAPVEALRIAMELFDKDVLPAMEAQVAADSLKMDKEIAKEQAKIARLRGAARALDFRIKRFEKARRDRAIALQSYRTAIYLYRDGKFARSAAQLQTALRHNPSGSIADRIHFGLGAAYFRLKKYPESIRHLQAIVLKHPASDKWLMANIFLGWIYNDRGEKSQSLYYLEKAIAKQPPAEVRKLIDRLIDIVREPAPETVTTSEAEPEKQEVGSKK